MGALALLISSMEIYYHPDVGKFLDKPDDATGGKMVRLLDSLEKNDGIIGMPHAKKLEKRLYELRIPGGRKVRVLYALNDGDILLLHAFVKKSARIPRKELNVARKRLKALARK